MPEKILSNIIEIKLITMMLLAWAARLAVRSHLTVGTIIRQLIISAFVGFITAEILFAKQFEEWVNVSLFCVAVFLADDILVLLLAFGEQLKANKKGLFKRLISILAGK